MGNQNIANAEMNVEDLYVGSCLVKFYEVVGFSDLDKSISLAESNFLNHKPC